jgi:signal transduction histidine kinase
VRSEARPPSIERRLVALAAVVLALQVVLWALLAHGALLRGLAPAIAVALAAFLLTRWALGRTVGALRVLADRVGAIASEDSWQAPLAAGELAEVREVASELEALRARIADSLARDQRLREEAAQASHYKSTFLKALSHELRTPLNAILGFSEVLLSQLEGPLSDDQRENLSMIQRSGKQLEALFDQVIELATMASGDVDLELEDLQPSELLEQIAEQAAPSASDRLVHLRVDVADGLPPLRADRERLFRVLFGLVAHAISVTTGAEVVVGAHLRGARVALSVLDPSRRTSGIEVEALLDASRELPRRKGVDEGTRLLLAISTELAELHGGSLLVEADGEQGAGTAFVLELPLGPSR